MTSESPRWSLHPFLAQVKALRRLCWTGHAKKKYFFQILLVEKICQLKKSKFSFSEKKDSHFYDEKLFSVGFEPEKGFPTQQCYHSATVTVVFI